MKILLITIGFALLAACLVRKFLAYTRKAAEYEQMGVEIRLSHIWKCMWAPVFDPLFWLFWISALIFLLIGLSM